MGWYNSGVWDGLDGTNIQNVLVSLCNAVNERREAINAPLVQWLTNGGYTTDPLVADDFSGLDLLKTNYLQQVYDQIEALVTSASHVAYTHCPGFAKASDDSAKGSDLWTMASLAVNIGALPPSTIATIFDQPAAEWCRDALDRLIYPVIYPTNEVDEIDQDIGSGTRTYWKSTVPNLPTEYTDAEAAWDAQAADGSGTASISGTATHAHFSVSPYWKLDDTVRYRAASFLRSVLQVAPNINGLGTVVYEYQGDIVNAWLVLRTNANTVSGDVAATVFGAEEIISAAGTGLTFREVNVPVDAFSATTSTNPVVHLADEPTENPFSGSFDPADPDLETATGIGNIGVYAFFRYEKTSPLISTIPGTSFTRFVLDLSPILTDQA